MTTTQAWQLVDAGQIHGEWRRWVSVADGKEFHWGDVDQRREALIECAEHVRLKAMTNSIFIQFHRSPAHYVSLIDGKKFFAADVAVARYQCEQHVQTLIQAQDGGEPQQRTLAERQELYRA